MMETSGKPRLIVISGPTGIGKTGLAIDMALRFNGEIVSSDSMQVYRTMDIGTAKPTPEEQDRVPHHMINIVDPDEPFDAAAYGRMGRECLRSVLDRDRVPFVTGGTGLYIKSLLYGMSDANPPPDPAIRQRLEAEIDEIGSETLHRRLAECDPDAAARIHPNDAFRIVRALEFHEAAGEPISAVHGRHRFAESPYRILKLCLKTDRERLYEHINRRVDGMIESGFVEEVKGLLQKGYDPSLKSMQSIGYRHVCDYLTGKTDWDRTFFLLKRDTRRFAKRQFTWFRADPEMIWVDPADRDGIEKRLREFFAGP